MGIINFAVAKPSIDVDERGDLVLSIGGIEVICIDHVDGQVFPLELFELDKDIIRGLGFELDDNFGIKFDGRAVHPISKI